MVLWFSKWIAIGITRCKCEAGGHKLIDMVSHDNLKRLTVVIPSYGRREFLKRQISYWNGSLVQVLILDGSDVSAYDLQFPQNFRYVHSREGFLQRLLSATEMVDTEFVALLPDDEFFLESGLVDAIDYMDSNDQAIGCVGRCLYFFVDQGRFCCHMRIAIGDRFHPLQFLWLTDSTLIFRQTRPIWRCMEFTAEITG